MRVDMPIHMNANKGLLDNVVLHGRLGCSLNQPDGLCRFGAGCQGGWAGAGARQVKSGSGARAGQSRIGQVGGSNPKREMRFAKKKKG